MSFNSLLDSTSRLHPHHLQNFRNSFNSLLDSTVCNEAYTSCIVLYLSIPCWILPPPSSAVSSRRKKLSIPCWILLHIHATILLMKSHSLSIPCWILHIAEKTGITYVFFDFQFLAGFYASWCWRVSGVHVKAFNSLLDSTKTLKWAQVWRRAAFQFLAGFYF